MVIDLAGSSETMIAQDPFLRVMGAVIACLAVVIVALGAFSALSGRLVVVGRRRAGHEPGLPARRFGLGQVLLGAALLIIGSQPFLSTTWLLRSVLLAAAAIFAIAAVVVQVSVLTAAARNR